MAAKKDVAKLMASVQKMHGPAAIMTAREVPKRPRVSSGSLALDLAIGGGGLPTDRAVEFFGAESCGKTSLGLIAMRNFLDTFPEQFALFFDMEGKTSMSRVEQLLGPQRMDRFIPCYPSYIEEATDIYKEMVASGHFCFVLYDSIAAGIAKRVTERSAEVAGGGRDAARLITEFARTAGNFSNKYATCTLGINQLRVDQDGFHRYMTVGGNGWRHACSLRVLLKEGSSKVFAKIDDENVEVGTHVVAKVVKNQLGGIEGRQAWWWMYTVPTEKYGFGIDELDEIVRLGIITDVIEQRGGWYYHPRIEGAKVQGRDRLVEAVRADPILYREIFEQVSTALRSARAIAAVAPVTDPIADLDESAFGPNILQRPMEDLTA